jgi:hypothetical protein
MRKPSISLNASSRTGSAVAAPAQQQTNRVLTQPSAADQLRIFLAQPLGLIAFTVATPAIITVSSTFVLPHQLPRVRAGLRISGIAIAQ